MRQGYWDRLMTALAGREVIQPSEGEWRARVAALEMDVRERDESIAATRKEYSTLEATVAGAGKEQIEKLCGKLASSMANIATLTALAGSGRQVEAADLVSVCRSLEKQLKAAGLEQIGTVGEQTAFDLASHQRMSGGSVATGKPVNVQMPGYRFGTKVLLKAMVTSHE